MNWQTALIAALTLIWLLTLIQGVLSAFEGLGFYRFVRRAIAAEKAGPSDFQPRAAIILPCCGVDERLHKTVDGLAQQNYADYEVVFTFESREDPAYEAVCGWTRDWKRPAHRMAIAGQTERRAQKIHNLLAALQEVSDDREVYVFLDSDAEPHGEWLRRLVAPLADPHVGAATGYRWYCAGGGWANGLRSCWNAATVTLLHDERLNFCWGGSTAVRRADFEALGVVKLWDRALSDDYQMTRAMREAGRAIRFVPQAMIPSHDRTTFGGFWQFARRQIIITRICGPEIWRAGFLLCLNFTAGGCAALGLFIAAALGWIGNTAIMWAALAGWAAIMGLASMKAYFRQKGLRLVLGPPAVTWQDFLWDVGGVNLSGVLHMALMISSIGCRRFAWRHTIYEMVSPDETRVLGRIPPPAPATTR